MRDGVGNNMKSKEQQSSDLRKCRGNEFGRELSKIAVAQMCNRVGFQSFKESALDTLADIAIKYLRHLGKIATFYANLAGRIECNVFDIIRGLEELESSQGFLGAWESDHCLANSGSVKNIVCYVNSVEEIPFAHPLPRFPVIRNRGSIPSFVQIGETPPSRHIPNWLPAFPDAHTYNHSALWRKKPGEPHAEKIELARQRRKAGKSLLGLQQRLISCGSERSRNGQIGFSGDESNSLLGTCLQEMEDGIGLHSDNIIGKDGICHLSVPEVFAPAIEAIKGGCFPNSQDDKAKILPRARPLVHFKLETCKTFLGGSMNLNAKMAGVRESVFWFRRDNERDQKRDGERDEKKRRVEYILRHSIDNPEELNKS
ncbi:transcription initiation factor TFIID subunit 8-like [Benincasa hispida]|uniref:transcription initiation factor TFIID subunit 8-like n=1 Tax=Benincasa hispida TaxID=102211 RepID=UPI0018FF2A23|nr:transcription initiation factor TFIID subunit 8-like [Benincasa hispida]